MGAFLNYNEEHEMYYVFYTLFLGYLLWIVLDVSVLCGMFGHEVRNWYEHGNLNQQREYEIVKNLAFLASGRYVAKMAHNGTSDRHMVFFDKELLKTDEWNSVIGYYNVQDICRTDFGYKSDEDRPNRNMIGYESDENPGTIRYSTKLRLWKLKHELMGIPYFEAEYQPVSKEVEID